jgi:RHS repeat-associated protein
LELEDMKLWDLIRFPSSFAASAPLTLAGVVVMFAIAPSCAAKHEETGNADLRTHTAVTGAGECRSLWLDADGSSSAAVVATEVTGAQPLTGYLFRSPEIVSWNATGAVSGTGYVTFSAAEGAGRFDFVAGANKTIHITSVAAGTPPASTMLHLTSLSAHWLVTGANSPSISLRFRVSPFPDGGANRCLVYQCDPVQGPKVCQPAAAGTLCSDGNICNGMETCDGAGACAPGQNPPSGTSCSDGNACNGEEVCTAGQCVAGTPLTASAVDDHNACTADSCDPNRGGIVNDPIAGCGSNAGATPLPAAGVGTFSSTTSFLYEGASPVQVGVAAGTIQTDRVAVIRGRVFGNDGVTVASGAVVTVLGHVEFGSTVTRSDGYYDLAVNGGPTYVVNVAASGMLPVQRRAATKVGDYSQVADIVLTPPQPPSADTFTPGASVGKLVRGPLTIAGVDSDPQRRASIYFPPNTQFANFTPPAGPLAVQLTEYTVGNGLSRMPGDLPPTSGYTYAVEAAFPAARAAGVEHVQFDRDVALYVDNFTGSHAGNPVPTGYYDFTRGAWLAEKSGRTVTVVSVAGGVANIDIDGDNVADDAAKLAAVGIGLDERNVLGAEYPAGGKQLWRTPVRHFSAWDFNWGIRPPDDAIDPPLPNPRTDEDEKPLICPGSIIGCESQTLGEEFPIVGTPYRLHYDSRRAPGYTSSIRVHITDGRPLPSSLRRIHVQISVAGRVYAYERQGNAAINQWFRWNWNPVDAYGRPITAGAYKALIRVGYEYGGMIGAGGGTKLPGTPSFGAAPGVTIDGDRAARVFTAWRESETIFVRADAKPLGLGGWMIDAQHQLVMGDENSLYHGDGTVRAGGSRLENSIDHLAGVPYGAGYVDNIAATSAYLGGDVQSLASGADGSIFLTTDAFTSSRLGRLRRIDPSGTITTLAGVPLPTGLRVAPVDGGPALNADVQPFRLAVGPDGDVYFNDHHLDYVGDQVWRVHFAATGGPILQLIAGGGTGAPNPACGTGAAVDALGDGGDAKLASLSSVQGIAVGTDGGVFIADSNNFRIRRVGPEGCITTYAPISASEIELRSDGVLFARDTSAANPNVFKITPDGRFGRLKNPATGLDLSLQTDVCGFPAHSFGGQFLAEADGSFLVDCRSKLVRVSPDLSHWQRIAGLDGYFDYGSSGDGGPALLAKLSSAAITHGTGLDLILQQSDSGTQTLRRFRVPNDSILGGYRVAELERSLVHSFDVNGLHLQTASSLRGAALQTFAYDGASRLSSITDVAGNQTQIARAGSTITITAPFSQVTTLGLDANGYVSTITNPNAEVIHVAHTASGLLTDFTDQRGYAHHFTYGPSGRLTNDKDAIPGTPGTRLARLEDDAGWSVELTSPAGRITRRRIEMRTNFTDPQMVDRRTSWFGADAPTVSATYADGSQESTSPDGTHVKETAMAFDPRWKSAAAYPSSVTLDVGTVTPRTITTSQNRSVVLGIPSDPFSVTSLMVTTQRAAATMPTGTSTSVFTSGTQAKWTSTSAAGRQTEVQVDALERPTQVSVLGSSPVTLYPVQYHYDARGRVDEVTWGSRIFTKQFDGAGWVSSTTAPANLGMSITSRDGNGRPLTMSLPGSRNVSTSYDASGNVTSVTPPGRPAHGFGFDRGDRLQSYAPPDLTPPLAPKDTLYQRDFDGRLTVANHPGKPVTLTYDDRGRLAMSIAAATTTVARDPAGRVTSIASDGVTITNGYDGAVLTQEAVSGPFAHAVNRTFDGFLRVTGEDVDGANPLTFSYDADDVVTSAGGMTVTRSTNGLLTDTSVGSVADTFSYNAYGEVLTHDVTGSATSYSATYTRDAAGRIDTKTEVVAGTTLSTQYTYDTAGRLSQVVENGAATRVYTYAPNGDRDGGTYDAQDRLVSYGGATFTYGNNGELTTKSIGGMLQGTYGYDAFGNLRSVTRPGANTITYVIDGLNRRVGKKLGGALSQGFLYAGSRIIAELDGAGAVVSRFAYATGEQSPDVMVRGGTTYRILKDHLGSPRLVVNASTGAIAQRLDYDEWGNTTESGTVGFQPFGFAGGLWDRDTNLVRFGARDYDPATGRWTTKDESRFDGGLNFYGYAENDPVNLIDPTGYDSIGAAIGGGLGATLGMGAGFVLGGGAGLAGLVGGPVVVVTVPTGAIVGATGGLLVGGAAGAFWGDKAGDAIRGWLENRRKGERNWAGKPTGTPTPDKKKPTLGKDGKWYRKDQNGRRLPMPKDWKPPPNGLVPPFSDDDEDGETCP